MDDPYISCPYDRIHRVPTSRIQRHLVKCEKRYPELKICPYNATHRFPEDKIKAHLEDCPTRLALRPDEYMPRNPLRDPDRKVCPYKFHPFPEGQMDAHLAKCPFAPARIVRTMIRFLERQPMIITCPYNATHSVSEDEMEAHLVNCPSKPASASLTTPKPMTQKKYLPETDPNHEM